MVFGSQDIWKMQTHSLSACRREGQPGAFTLPDFQTSQLAEPSLAADQKHAAAPFTGLEVYSRPSQHAPVLGYQVALVKAVTET